MFANTLKQDQQCNSWDPEQKKIGSSLLKVIWNLDEATEFKLRLPYWKPDLPPCYSDVFPELMFRSKPEVG